MSDSEYEPVEEECEDEEMIESNDDIPMCIAIVEEDEKKVLYSLEPLTDEQNNVIEERRRKHVESMQKWCVNNPEKVKALQEKRRIDPEQRAKRAESSRRYYHAHRDQIKERRKCYPKANPEKH